jgi:hypothetical protein
MIKLYSYAGINCAYSDDQDELSEFCNTNFPGASIPLIRSMRILKPAQFAQVKDSYPMMTQEEAKAIC